MHSIFVYGTLRHVPLLTVVLGRAADALDLQDADLVGHQVQNVKGHDFPILTKGGDSAKGLLINGLNDQDIARLRFYEGSFQYDLVDVEVMVSGQTAKAQVFEAEAGVWTPEGVWSLARWAENYGELTVYGAIEELSYFGNRTRSEVDAILPMIRARATAKVNGANDNRPRNPGGMTRNDVENVTITRPYSVYFTLEEYDLNFRQYSGSTSEMVRRAVFVATDAVIVLPYDPVRDRVLLVEQFRPGPFARADKYPWQLEPIAGRVDASETPERTAHREAREEAGLTLDHLEEVARCYASPGCSTEFYHIFLGTTDLPDGVEGVAGLSEESEDIRSYLFSFDELMEMTDSLEVVNAPLALAALWLARHRDRLRAAA